MKVWRDSSSVECYREQIIFHVSLAIDCMCEFHLSSGASLRPRILVRDDASSGEHSFVNGGSSRSDHR